jgi:hypothetical protein
MIAASDRRSVFSGATKIAQDPHDLTGGLCDAGMEDLPLSLDPARSVHM